MGTIDLVALEIFRTVAEQGGIGRAAMKLNRVQSNVTTRVKQLEHSLGVTLFLRQGRGIVLSPEGRVLLSYAERLLTSQMGSRPVEYGFATRADIEAMAAAFRAWARHPDAFWAFVHVAALARKPGG